MTESSPVPLFRCVLFVAVLLGLSESPVVSGDQSSAAERPVVQQPADAVVVGINGHYRVGHPTMIRLVEPLESNPSAAEASNHVFDGYLESTDGDGVRVRYDPIPDSTGGQIGYVVPGSEAAPLKIVRREDGTTRDLVNMRFPTAGDPTLGPTMIPSVMPWVIAIGDPLGVDRIGVSNVLVDKTASIAVTKITDAQSLPLNNLGYGGVDLVMINAPGADVLASMTITQQDALATWLRHGGKMMVCLGESAGQIAQAAPWLIEMLPIEEVAIERYDPAAFEMFMSSQNPLSDFRGVKLPRRVGRALISGRTTRRITAVQAAEYVVGFGHVAVVAADLDRPEFAEWPERLEFVTQLAGEMLTPQSENRDVRDRSTTFGDLAGQMRGTLDQFPIKTSFSFSFLSVIVMLLIAAIGPLDYLLINRVFGKPLLGWLSFPIIAIALSAVLVTQAAPNVAKSASEKVPGENSVGNTLELLRANQFQVTDIDLIDGVGRGFAWCTVYSHEPVEVDLRYSTFEAMEPIRQADANGPTTFVFPMGYPGKVFGGIEMANENSVFGQYEVTPKSLGRGMETSVQQLTIAPRSSKSLAARVSFTPKTVPDIGVTRRPGSELLRGEFVNPLPYDILDGVLVYGNWVYLLPTRVPAGASVPQLNDLRQKNFRWRLTRQHSLEKNETETTPWSPSDFTDSKRVAEMMMFHRAAGGELYTGLRHDALGDLDLSDVLVEDRCILVGRTEVPLFDLQVRDRGDQSETFDRHEGDVLSVVRVILPVRTTRLN
ncbi:MAG: hypothetical protein KDB00_06420 [Planctomycetales bacterium]|nr:hypothetical protein [Planctomycetales bacterium]